MATKVITMELLGRGAHANPRRGGNVLELASVLAGERWTTSPQSVHPALAAVASTVNDLLTDDRRRLLAPLAPWLLDTKNTDPRVWPAVATVCIRAAMASTSGQGQARLLADLDLTRKRLADVSSQCGERRRGHWADRRDRRWAICAIHSALVAVAASANQEDADAAMCQVMVDCINERRQLAGDEAVDPRLPLADCPQRIVVEPRVMWSPGCDWMELGYQPVPSPLPARASMTQTQWSPHETESTTVQSSGKRVEGRAVDEVEEIGGNTTSS